MKRILQIYRDGKPSGVPLTTPLADGEQGNVETLAAMAEIVRYDVTQPDLREWVRRVVLGGNVAGHNSKGEINAIFEFARDRITYRRDPFGVERVADLWSTISILKMEGDCGVKSQFIATCCGLLGYRPFFTVIKQRPDQAAFNHVYNMVVADGEVIYLDATPGESVPGWEAQSVLKQCYPIFTK